MASKQPSSGQGPLYEEVMRQKYNDPAKLRDLLDELYGRGNYSVKTKSSRWILRLPAPLKEGQMEWIENQVCFHY
ncbi:hypothetical protein V2G26_012316 [Clonostachys chloroleuca]